ncbi:MAG TPA: hypothetical protein VFR07_08125 [Mycobacteriales bacterium]|jgi:hypothetical protein|nr:hypothetical protein [Mycobacteriales bacterium]
MTDNPEPVRRRVVTYDQSLTVDGAHLLRRTVLFEDEHGQPLDVLTIDHPLPWRPTWCQP